MNLPARSPALRTYPPVVQHTWSTNYVPPRTQHLSVWTQNIRTYLARFPTRE